MAGRILLSTAYLPPVAYISAISGSDEVILEKEENYLKQTFRNRCYILSANGPHFLTVPVLLGSFHKTAVKEIRIDNSKRWRQVHLGALSAAYRSSPYFEYYFDGIERILTTNHNFLIDMNLDLLDFILSSLRMDKVIRYTDTFLPVKGDPHDWRYAITPKTPLPHDYPPYTQVFSSRYGFVAGLSIADLLFNCGPDSPDYFGKKRPA